MELSALNIHKYCHKVEYFFEKKGLRQLSLFAIETKSKNVGEYSQDKITYHNSRWNHLRILIDANFVRWWLLMSFSWRDFLIYPTNWFPQIIDNEFLNSS